MQLVIAKAERKFGHARSSQEHKINDAKRRVKALAREVNEGQLEVAAAQIAEATTAIAQATAERSAVHQKVPSVFLLRLRLVWSGVRFDPRHRSRARARRGRSRARPSPRSRGARASLLRRRRPWWRAGIRQGSAAVGDRVRQPVRGLL